MSEHAPAPPPATSGTSRFDERLTVPWWWYLPAIGVAAILAAEVHMGYPGVRAWIGYAVLVPLAVLLLVRLGRVRVRVADGVLHAGDRALALDHVGRVDVVTDRDAKQVALGPDLDPRAHLLHRAWVRPVVRIEVLDPEATEPYWVVSTRDPDGLVAALGR
jgi:hypothetical protein